MKQLLALLILSLAFVSCNDGGSGKKKSKLKFQSITAASSQFAQDIAGKEWCGLATFEMEEEGVELYDKYTLNTDGSAVYSLVSVREGKAVSTETAAWSATEEVLTFKSKKHKVSSKAYLEGGSLIIINTFEGEEYREELIPCVERA